MLSSLRGATEKVWVKLLLGLIALTFVVWGVGDFSGGRSHIAAKVGDQNITERELDIAVRERLRVMPDVNAEWARSMTLSTLVNQRLLYVQAHELGMRIGDDAILKRIVSEPMLQGEDGNFSAERFRQVLLQMSLTEQQFIEQSKQELLRELILQPLGATPVVSDVVSEVLADQYYERRKGHIITVPTDFVKEVSEPTEAQLMTFYEERPELFRAPEYRRYRFIEVNCAALEKSVVSAEVLRELYTQRVLEGMYQMPESRVVRQLLFSDKEHADMAYARLNTGEKIENIAADLEEYLIASQDTLKETTVTQDAVLPELREVLFSDSVKRYTLPTQTPLGWHVFSIEQKRSQHAKTFHEVRDEMEHEMLAGENCEATQRAFRDMDDAFAGGARLSDVRDFMIETDHLTHALTLIEGVEADVQGNGVDGKPVSTLPSYRLPGVDMREHFFEQVFMLEPGDDPVIFTPTEHHFVAVEVESVTPSRIKTLDELRGVATQAWKETERQRLSKAYVESLRAAVKQGGTLQEVAAKKGLAVEPMHFHRLEVVEDSGHDPQFINDAFATLLHQPTHVHETEDGYVLAVITEIIPFSSLPESEREAAIATTQDRLRDDWSSEVVAHMLRYAGQVVPVRVGE